MKNQEQYQTYVIRENNERINHNQWIDIHTRSRSEKQARDILEKFRELYPHREFALVRQTELVLDDGMIE